MANPAMTEDAHIRHAARVDNSDPFVASRLASHAKTGLDRPLDYSKTRRVPMPVDERFTLVMKRPR